MAFMGEQGWGKSTLAAAFYQRGHPLVADDVLPVDLTDPKGPRALPGIPRIKLWPEAATFLSLDLPSLPIIHPFLDKRELRADQGFSPAPLPLRRIYLLAEGSETEITPCSPQEAFLGVLRNSYCASLLPATGEPAHLVKIAALVNAAPLRWLRSPWSLSSLAGLLDLVEEDAGVPSGSRAGAA